MSAEQDPAASGASAATASLTYWASAWPLPPVTAGRPCWQVTIRLTVGGIVSDIAALDVESDHATAAAPLELDTAVTALGYRRSTGWELGRDAGYVAWVEPLE